MRNIYKEYANWKDVLMPQIIKNLPKDPRGYPIPANVTWLNGKPIFKANDIVKENTMAENRQCSVTAVLMDRSTVRLITSPLNALGRPATVMDAPIHKDALDYSMKVCPYMCLGQYYKGFQKNFADKLNDKHDSEGVFFQNTSPVSTVPPFMIAIHPKHLQAVEHGPTDRVYTVYPSDIIGLELYQYGDKISFKEARPQLEEYLQVPEIADRLASINRKPSEFLARFELYAKEYGKDRS